MSSDLGKWILPLATAMIAWGGYPAPPKAFVELTRHELVRYALLFILIWQGGGGQDVTVSLVTTAIIYFVIKIFEVREKENFDTNYFSPYKRSFSRSSDINDAVLNAKCNPNGIYYTMRYNQPSIQYPQYPGKQYPYTYGYYNACGNAIKA